MDPNWCYCGHHITQHDPSKTYLCIICGECEGFAHDWRDRNRQLPETEGPC